MIKNAILIAGILFVAGCATNQSDYRRSASSSNYPSPDSDVALSRSTELVDRTPQGELIPPSDSSLSSQSDPASGGFGSSVSGSGVSSYNSQTSVNDYHADSSVRGGSTEARGYARGNLRTEGQPHPMDPSVQADSSIRGGSRMARQQERTSNYEPASSTPDGTHIKADSSIRGGSNEARNPQRNLRSSNSAPSDDTMVVVVTPVDDSDMQPLETQSNDDFGRSRSDSSASEQANGSVRASANWNPSDDLLPDGIQSKKNRTLHSEANVGGAAEAGSKSGSSDANLQVRQFSSKPSGDLNSSRNLEKDISGTYDINRQSPASGLSDPERMTEGKSAIPADKADTSSVGGPGSTETGVASSSGDQTSSALRSSSSQEGLDLFRNNRAHGVGSAATGELGAGNSTNLQGGESDLAQRVKRTLTRESTGTFGMTRADVAKGVQVSSQGSTIILKGTVPSQKDKDMLEIRAREISGVQRVQNEVTVAPQDGASALNDLKLGRDLEDTTDQLKDLNKE